MAGLARLALPIFLAVGSLPAAAASGSDLALFATLGGGGAAGGSDRYATRGGLLEAELGAGLELPRGLRPEIAATLWLAPETHLGLRPALRYAFDGYPFFVRGGLDFASPGGEWTLRWLYAAAGGELRITHSFGVGGEFGAGVPLAGGVGFGLFLRAGVTFRL